MERPVRPHTRPAALAPARPPKLAGAAAALAAAPVSSPGSAPLGFLAERGAGTARADDTRRAWLDIDLSRPRGQTLPLAAGHALGESGPSEGPRRPSRAATAPLGFDLAQAMRPAGDAARTSPGALQSDEDLATWLRHHLARCRSHGSRAALLHVRSHLPALWQGLDDAAATDPARHGHPTKASTTAATASPRADSASNTAHGHLHAWLAQLQAALPPASELRLDRSGNLWMLVDRVASAPAALAWAKRLEPLVRAPGRAGDAAPPALGACLLPVQAQDAATALRLAAATSARAASLAGGRRCAVHDPARVQAAVAEQAEQARLRAALAAGQLELRIQARAPVEGEGLCAAQADLNWPRRRTDRGLASSRPMASADQPVNTDRRRQAGASGVSGLSGNGLADLADRAGLSEGLSRELLEAACRQLASWEAQGVSAPPLSVRLEGDWAAGPELAAELTMLLARYHLAPRRLVLELGPQALDALAGHGGELLARAGVELVVDAAQVDLVSLAACRHLPIQALSIDLAALGDIQDAASRGRASLQTLVALARGMGLRLIVKSVESADTLAVLGHLRCDEYQGAVLAHPLPARLWTRLLERGGSDDSETAQLS